MNLYEIFEKEKIRKFRNPLRAWVYSYKNSTDSII